MADAIPPKLPNMNEFSPSVMGELRPLLLAARAFPGDRDGLKIEIVKKSRSIKPVPNNQHLNRANNVLIGMSECGLYDLKANQLTKFGEELSGIADTTKLYSTFARHLLEKCRGNELFDVIRSLGLKQEKISGEAIRSEFRARGFTVTINEGNASKIRLWLEKSSVIDENWTIDEKKYNDLMGISLKTRDDWSLLTQGQQAFLDTLRNASAGTSGPWVSTGTVTELCISKWGKAILPKEADRRAKLIQPLESGQWLESRGIGAGRGGKGGEIRPAKKLLEAKTGLIVAASGDRGIPKELIKKLDTPLSDIYRDLESSNTYRKGVALELLCLKLCLDLNVEPVELRKRGIATKGAEVDLIAENTQLNFSRWMFQCKNTPKTAVSLEDIAKEVGLAGALKAHVVVVATTGRFTKDAERFALQTTGDTHLQVILIDGSFLKQVRGGGELRLVELFKSQALAARKLKKAQLGSIMGGQGSQ